MPQRGVEEEDVYEAIRSASPIACSHNEGNKWRVTGLDLDGDELTLIIAITDKAIVITVF